MGTYGPLEDGQAQGEEVNYLRTPEIGTYYIAFDVSNTDKAVRQAMAYVVNREDIADSTFKQRLPPGYHLTPPSIYPGGAEAYDRHRRGELPIRRRGESDRPGETGHGRRRLRAGQQVRADDQLLPGHLHRDGPRRARQALGGPHRCHYRAHGVRDHHREGQTGDPAVLHPWLDRRLAVPGQLRPSHWHRSTPISPNSATPR